MAKILWSNFFIAAQGNKIVHKKLLQYNKSAIFMGGNGKNFNSKWTQHIKTRYLFVHYRMEQSGLLIYHCPMESMWDEILFNSIQGREFREFISELMN